jgi:hypothetical protein
MAVRLRVRQTATSPWVENFDKLGWKLRDTSNAGWMQLHPGNTKVRSSDNTKWLNVK